MSRIKAASFIFWVIFISASLGCIVPEGWLCKLWKTFHKLHNHPYGNISPSNQDLAITKKLKEAGQLMDLNILDHIILLPDGYVSMADEGIP